MTVIAVRLTVAALISHWVKLNRQISIYEAANRIFVNEILWKRIKNLNAPSCNLDLLNIWIPVGILIFLHFLIFRSLIRHYVEEDDAASVITSEEGM